MWSVTCSVACLPATRHVSIVLRAGARVYLVCLKCFCTAGHGKSGVSSQKVTVACSLQTFLRSTCNGASPLPPESRSILVWLSRVFRDGPCLPMQSLISWFYCENALALGSKRLLVKGADKLFTLRSPHPRLTASLSEREDRCGKAMHETAYLCTP